MKKLTFLALVIAVALVSSCKNQNKKDSEDSAQKEVSVKEHYLTEDLKANLDDLIASTKKMNPATFCTRENDRFVLTDKEKLVKPDYLLDPSVVNDLITFSQKYRVVSMLSADKAVAELYDMPVDRYNSTLARIVLDLNDPAFQEYWESTDSVKVAFSRLVDDEYAANRANFLWESVAAYLVEQLYICTRNIDKFMPMFTDEIAAEISYNFICVHEGIKSLLEFYPEMASLNEVLDPLYVINALNVEQLRSQLTELKGQIEVIRTMLLQ